MSTLPSSAANTTKPNYDAGREALVASLLVGESTAMRRLRGLIVRVGGTRLPVLIEGPTGAGKELVAQALHAVSGRPGPLVALNVCAVGEALFEDALFGHVRGAFTGAVGEARGYLTEADHGTLFLDEIGALPLGPQAKLLRALETGQFRPVGSAKDRTSDFRVIAASNVPTSALCASGAFRADLVHRLSGIVLETPPLRDRMEDVPLLARHFMESASVATGLALSLDAGALDALGSWEWPGNVRELRLTLERAVALAPSSCLGRADVLAAMRRQREATAGPMPREAFLQRRLLEVLERAEWDIDVAAATLGVHRATVYRRLERLRGGAADGSARTASHGRRTASRDAAAGSRDEMRHGADLPA